MGRIIVLALLLASGCIMTLPGTKPPPTAGYGDPYKGTGKPIYVKDSRDDWDISEGAQKISSEQALEASGDPEYEARRQIAKAHNDKLYREGKARRSRGSFYTKAGIVVMLAGIVVAAIVPDMVLGTHTVDPTASMPEMLTTSPSGASQGAAWGGAALAGVGAATAILGWIEGRKQPPYHIWKTPGPLNRPAYIREHTEALNEKLGAPPASEQPGGVEDLPLAPGQRKPPPPRPTTMKMRGDK